MTDIWRDRARRVGTSCFQLCPMCIVGSVGYGVNLCGSEVVIRGERGASGAMPLPGSLFARTGGYERLFWGERSARLGMSPAAIFDTTGRKKPLEPLAWFTGLFVADTISAWKEVADP